MNKNLLASHMARHGDTQQKLADEMGISFSRLNAKINEKGGAQFLESEMKFIVDRYKLKPKEVYEVFFA